MNTSGKTLARTVTPDWPGWIATGFAAAGAWLLLQHWAVTGVPLRVTCVFKEWTHVGCPTCGFTRALLELARGRLGASLVLHPMALPVACELIAAWALWGVALARGGPGLRQRWIPAIVLANAVAFAVVWLARLVTGTLTA